MNEELEQYIRFCFTEEQAVSNAAGILPPRSINSRQIFLASEIFGSGYAFYREMPFKLKFDRSRIYLRRRVASDFRESP